MKRFGFFNSINGDRKYLASDISEALDVATTTGIKQEEGVFEVTPYEDMTIKINPGSALIHGGFFTNPEDELIELDMADGELNRIDRIAIRYDRFDRSIDTVVLKGTNALNPTPPTPLRNENQFDLVLADIYIRKAATEILTSDITDMRESELCGYIGVKGAVSQLEFDAHLAEKAKFYICSRLENQSVASDIVTLIGWNDMTPYNGADFCDLSRGVITFTQSGVYEIQMGLMLSKIVYGLAYPTTSSRLASAFQAANVLTSAFWRYQEGDNLNARLYQNSGNAVDILSDNKTILMIRQVARL